MASDSAYHIKLDGKGYVLLDESYFLQSQQPFSPRFATGDPSFGDLSFWQFLTQEEFDAGEGQEVFEIKNKYQYASGWDVRDGKPRLARGTESVTKANSFPTPDSAPGSVSVLLDDFSDGDFTSNPTWTVQNGNWSIVSNALQNGVAIADNQISTPQTSTQGTWEFTIDGGPGSAALATGQVFFMLDQAFFGGNGYGIELRPVGTLPPASNLTAHLVRLDAGVVTTLQSYGNVGFGVNTYTISRDATGNFTVKINGSPQSPILDSTHNTSTHILVRTVGAGLPPDAWDYDAFRIPIGAVGGSANVGLAVNALPYNNEIYVAYTTSDPAFTFTTVVDGDLSLNIPTVHHINAQAIGMVNRDISGLSRYLVAVNGSTMKIFDGTTEIASISLTVIGTCISPPIDGSTVVIGGTEAVFNGVPAFEVVRFNASAWTVSAQKIIRADGGVQGNVASHAALDQNGTLYFASNDLSDNKGTMPSRLFRITSTDLQATNPRVTRVDFLPDFMARGLFELGGNVYMFGSRVNGEIVTDAILQTNRTYIYESTLSTDISTASASVRLNYGVGNSFKLLDSVLFLTRNELNDTTNILEMESDGSILNIASFNKSVFANADPHLQIVIDFGGRFYYLDPVADDILRTGTARGSFTDGPTNLSLRLSEFGGNTPLIDKSLYSVQIEVSEAIPASETLTIDVNGTTVGTLVNADGTSKEIILTSELTGSSFQPTLTMPRASTWSGYIKRITLRYIPTQFKRRQWGLAVRLGNNLKLISGQREQRTADEMMQDIVTAWSKNVPIDFIDVDGRSYKVIITDFKGRQPIQHQNQDRREYIVPMELLEV